MAAGGEALAGRLDPDERDAVVGRERREGPDRVRAAADAGDDAPGQPPAALEQLRARLVADPDADPAALDLVCLSGRGDKDLAEVLERGA